MESNKKNEEKLAKRKEGLILIKERAKKSIEEINNSFLSEIEFEKNRASFYRWLIIFEELCQKLGMKSEAEIEKEFTWIKIKRIEKDKMINNY